MSEPINKTIKEADLDVGERLKILRISNKLSQRQLAKKAGVTNSTISMIEKNSVSPTISSLTKVLNGIPISLDDFFSDEKFDLTQQVTYSYDELINISMGNVNRRLVGNAFPQRQMTFLIETYPSEADTGILKEGNNGEEAGFVLAGNIELTVDDKIFILKKGDSFYFDKNKPHRFRNKFKEVCKIISATTPLST